MLTALEKCENCGRSIGRLEEVHLWKERTVCAECLRRLRSNMPESGEPGFGRMFWMPLLILLMAAVLALAIYGRNKANQAAETVIDETKLKSDNAQLMAENKKLAGTIVELRTPPKMAPPLPPLVKAEISGAVWITRNDGSSDIQRGVTVRIVKSLMQGKALSAALANDEKVWRDSAAFWRKANSQKEGDGEHIDLGPAPERFAKAADAMVAQIGSMIQQMPDILRVEDAIGMEQNAMYFSPYIELGGEVALLNANQGPYRAHILDAIRGELNALDHAQITSGYFQAAIATVAIQSTTTSVEGKFSFTDIPPGDYFVSAQIDTTTFFAHWLVPISVNSSGRKSLDLYNANAKAMANSR